MQQVWSARGLKPHRVETFKLSNDPKFEEKLVDVVGLYLNPPEKAIVLRADEKSSVQALDRTQASLPMVKGRGQQIRKLRVWRNSNLNLAGNAAPLPARPVARVGSTSDDRRCSINPKPLWPSA